MIEQYGVLPYRIVEGDLGILLVTSRRTGRWVIPKGNPIRGLSPSESAAREAYEEAGIEGTTVEQQIGTYRYRKYLFLGFFRAAQVIVFPMRVECELETWPEEQQRKRQWFDRDAAARATLQGGLRRLILGFAPPG